MPNLLDANGDDTLDVTQNTRVKLGAVIAVVIFLGTSWNWLDGRFKALEAANEGRFKALESSMGESVRRVEAATSDGWTRTDQRLLMLEFQIRNPKLVVPTLDAKR